MVDAIYIAASAGDARFTRICVASVRYFYPDVPIRLLPGGRLQRGLTDELKQYWDVEMSAFAPGDYGWGFVKLEPLFASPGATFLVLDSDTVLTGPILDVWMDSDAPFLVADLHARFDRNGTRIVFHVPEENLVVLSIRDDGSAVAVYLQI